MMNEYDCGEHALPRRKELLGPPPPATKGFVDEHAGGVHHATYIFCNFHKSGILRLPHHQGEQWRA